MLNRFEGLMNSMSMILSKEFMLFALVGVMNTIISFVAYSSLVFINVPYLIANIISYLIGMLNSFILNKKFVFNKQGENKDYFVKFSIVNLITLSLQTGILYLFVTVMGLQIYYSQIAVTFIVLLLNFAGNKLWTFR